MISTTVLTPKILSKVYTTNLHKKFLDYFTTSRCYSGLGKKALLWQFLITQCLILYAKGLQVTMSLPEFNKQIPVVFQNNLSAVVLTHCINISKFPVSCQLYKFANTLMHAFYCWEDTIPQQLV